jgi:hypothetical protein
MQGMPIGKVYMQHVIKCGVCDLFYKITSDIVKLLLEIHDGNKYILVAIDHYSKWCQVKMISNHPIGIVAKFLEEDITCRYGMLEFFLTNNGGEWLIEFDNLCKMYGIQHQYTTP